MPGVVTLLSFSDEEKATLVGDKDRKANAQKIGKEAAQLVGDLFTQTRELATQHPSDQDMEVVDHSLTQVAALLSALPSTGVTQELQGTVNDIKKLVESSRNMINSSLG